MTRASDEDFAAKLTTNVRSLPLPIGLIDLQSGNVIAVSENALEFRTLGIDEILDRPVLAGIHPMTAPARPPRWRQWPPATSTSSAYARSRSQRKRKRPVIAWVRRVEFGDRQLALFEVADASHDPASALAAFVGREPFEMAVGSLDETGKVSWMSRDISTVVGLAADAFVGTELISRVQRDEVDRVLEAGRGLGHDHAVGLRIHVRDGAGEWRPVHLILAALEASPPLRLFILTLGPEIDEDSAARVADLEYHLWKIAGEVAAAGIITRMGAVPSAHLLPEHGTLTTRQWDVLGRLARGERVPTIAKELVLSQSTVRGHVATILKRFGVHSQPELLELLQDRSTSS